jgi:hypothetical protein
MKLGKLIQTLTLSLTFVSPAVGAWALIPSPISAEYPLSTEISLNLPASPSGGTSNGSGTAGGGRRAPGELCTNSSQPPLTMLMSHQVNRIEVPENARNSQNHLSLYWYLPETNAKKAEFLISKNGKFVYFQEFDIPQDTKGLVRLDLPANIPFEEDTIYKWELALVCQEFDRSSDEYVWGAVQPLNNSQRETLNSELEVARFNPRQENASSAVEAQANVYIRHNLWNKAFDVLSESSSSSHHVTSNEAEETTCAANDPRCQLLEFFGLNGHTDLIGIVNEDGFTLIP